MPDQEVCECPGIFIRYVIDHTTLIGFHLIKLGNEKYRLATGNAFIYTLTILLNCVQLQSWICQVNLLQVLLLFLKF